MSLIDLACAEGFEEAVGDPAHRGELEDLQDQDGPGEQRADQQADHDDLNQHLCVHEHFERAEVTGVLAAYVLRGGVGRGRVAGRGRRRGWSGGGWGRGRGGGWRRVLRHRRRSCHQRQGADEGEKGSGFLGVKHRFASSCLVFARPRTRRDRRAGRLSALAGGGPARTRNERSRKSKALVSTPVPPRSDPISSVGLARVSRRSQTCRWRGAAASPYRNVRLAVPVLWQPLISASRGGGRSSFGDGTADFKICLQRSIDPALTILTFSSLDKRRRAAAQQEDLAVEAGISAFIQPRTSRRRAEERLDRLVKRERPNPPWRGKAWPLRASCVEPGRNTHLHDSYMTSGAPLDSCLGWRSGGNRR